MSTDIDGTKVRTARLAQSVSVIWLSEKVGVNVPVLNRIERNDTHVAGSISARNLMDLADALNTTVDELTRPHCETESQPSSGHEVVSRPQSTVDTLESGPKRLIALIAVSRSPAHPRALMRALDWDLTTLQAMRRKADDLLAKSALKIRRRSQGWDLVSTRLDALTDHASLFLVETQTDGMDKQAARVLHDVLTRRLCTLGGRQGTPTRIALSLLVRAGIVDLDSKHDQVTLTDRAKFAFPTANERDRS